ncbi:major egg antigen-like [Saccoglossus kowalevskii]|uniref:Major egg antigen-like n=1 Tax=Saccoglossus kowalevskii TaxID=10224 RepID=A0ABM0MFL2_SACKO|nr:PREDICTED: major egg antigen-like [Saccoglossus kowalevskii]
MSCRMFPTFRMARHMGRGRKMHEVMNESQWPRWRSDPCPRQWADMPRRRLLDETFVCMEDMVNERPLMSSFARCRNRIRPARWFVEKMEGKRETASEGEPNNIGENENKFEVAIDLAHFKPENIEVRLLGNRLRVRAIQEDTGKEGYREYCQNYELPKTVDIEALTSKLTNEGTLTLEAPLMDAQNPYARTIPTIREVPLEVETEKVQDSTDKPEDK